MLTRLMYASEVRDLGPGGAPAILDRARSQNALCGVTGLLVHSDQYFLQFLEGSRSKVTETFGRIIGDRRHHNVELICVADTAARQFTAWTMAYLPPTPGLRAALAAFMPGGLFRPGSLPDGAVVPLIERLQSLQPQA